MIKAKILRILGPRTVRRIRSIFSKHALDEVRIVYECFAGKKIVGTMIDVGAHHGSSLASFAEDGWRILAFEPDDNNRSFLSEAHGHRDNLTIDVRAVSNRNESRKPFFASRVSSGISGLSSFHSSHEQRQTVDVITLSDALVEHGVTEVDFLKIDTEGYDLFVLRGIEWSNVQPTVIVCEFEDRKTLPLGYSCRDIVEYLKDRGYKVSISEWWPITEYGATHAWRRFIDDPELLASDAWGNLIAYQSERDFLELSVQQLSTRFTE